MHPKTTAQNTGRCLISSRVGVDEWTFMPGWAPCRGHSDLFSPRRSRFQHTVARSRSQIKQFLVHNQGVTYGGPRALRAGLVRFVLGHAGGV